MIFLSRKKEQERKAKQQTTLVFLNEWRWTILRQRMKKLKTTLRKAIKRQMLKIFQKTKSGMQHGSKTADDPKLILRWKSTIYWNFPEDWCECNRWKIEENIGKSSLLDSRMNWKWLTKWDPLIYKIWYSTLIYEVFLPY